MHSVWSRELRDGRSFVLFPHYALPILYLLSVRTFVLYMHLMGDYGRGEVPERGFMCARMIDWGCESIMVVEIETS